MSYDPDVELATLDKPRNRTKKPGEVGHKTALAKQYYLHGNGDGKPVRSVAKLSELTGAAPNTIERWLPVWQRESVAIAKAESGGKQEQASKVTGGTVALQQVQVNRLKLEMERLESLLPTLPDGSDTHADCLKLYMAVVKAWTEQSGFTAYREIETTIAKEQAKTLQRAARQNDAGGEERNVTPFRFLTSGKEK
jgi:hypothetical protein